jgi:hypothetical protein
VQKVITEPLLALATPGPLAAMNAVATTVRDAALLLDVQMDQLPGPLALVAHDLASGPV